MIKAPASIFLFCFRFFGVTALILLPDILVFSVFCMQGHAVLTGPILLRRILYIYAVAAPVVFFFSFTAGSIRTARKNAVESAVEFVLGAVVAVVSILLFLRFSGKAETAGNPYLYFNYCFIGTEAALFFPDSFGASVFRVFSDEAAILLPFGSFSSIAFRLLETGMPLFFVYGVILFTLTAVSVRFCSCGQWPLFNISVCLLALYATALLHRLWLTAADRLAFPAGFFAAGIITVDSLIAAVMIFLIWRRSRDTVF